MLRNKIGSFCSFEKLRPPTRTICFWLQKTCFKLKLLILLRKIAYRQVVKIILKSRIVSEFGVAVARHTPTTKRNQVHFERDFDYLVENRQLSEIDIYLPQILRTLDKPLTNYNRQVLVDINSYGGYGPWFVENRTGIQQACHQGYQDTINI